MGLFDPENSMFATPSKPAAPKPAAPRPPASGSSFSPFAPSGTSYSPFSPSGGSAPTGMSFAPTTTMPRQSPETLALMNKNTSYGPNGQVIVTDRTNTRAPVNHAAAARPYDGTGITPGSVWSVGGAATADQIANDKARWARGDFGTRIGTQPGRHYGQFRNYNEALAAWQSGYRPRGGLTYGRPAEQPAPQATGPSPWQILKYLNDQMQWKNSFRG